MVTKIKFYRNLYAFVMSKTSVGVDKISILDLYTLRLLLLAGTNFCVLVFCCIWQVFILAFFLDMFFLFITGKLNEIERRTNFSGYLI